jgi:sorbitol-specific phosphotransferase system component IIBC
MPSLANVIQGLRAMAAACRIPLLSPRHLRMNGRVEHQPNKA